MLYSALTIITIPPASYKQALAPHTSDLISLFSWLQLSSYLKLYFFSCVDRVMLEVMEGSRNVNRGSLFWSY